jgi:hypothetical protein
MESPRDQFKQGAFHVLSLFQVIEFSLKSYISISYRLIRLTTKNVIPFTYSDKDVEDLPLSKLISHFEKINSNKTLHSKLRSIIKSRNSLAHRGFLPGFLSATLEENLQESISEFKKLDSQLSECMTELQSEFELLDKKFTELGFGHDA